ISVDMEKILIGRGAPCDVMLPDARVSYHHATIETVKDLYHITDTGSKNGTHLQDVRLHPGKRYPLSTGDAIRIGGFVLTVNVSVPVAEAYSAEKTDILARNMLVAGSKENEKSGLRLEIIEGESKGMAFEAPKGSHSVSVGTADDCDLVVTEKVIRNLKLMIALTPAGWKIDEESVADHFRSVTYPARGRLHDGDEITIKKTVIRVHDDVDKTLSRLKTDKELEAGVEPPPPENTQLSPSDLDAAHETGPAPEEKQPAPSPVRQQEPPGKEEKYSTEYRIAAIAIGIIAFLVSLLILIFILF
ncbi:MAG: FHA domain-containing protein, partial [Pseudomonadota bacterium]